jgi:N-acetylmuramic acid 6-phosphate (MurNAc-6-P) etherase
VLNGKVNENFMIDVKVTNNKLYLHALGIVQHFGSVDNEEATQGLLKTIYETDCLTKVQLSTQISQYIHMATNKYKVVPIAIVISKIKCTYKQAKQILNECPIIKQAIVNLNM